MSYNSCGLLRLVALPRKIVCCFALLRVAYSRYSRGNTFPSNTFGKGPGEAFVHLFSWSWDDIAKECEDFLGPKGFTAVQISPPQEHQIGTSWNDRYRPVSFNLVSQGGNEAQLASMIKRCAAVGVDIYVDIVVNQFAGPWGGVGVAGTKFADRSFGDAFGPEDFHHLPGDSSTNCGVDDYKDANNVQYCDLMGMPDVCTGCPAMQDKIAAYVNHLHALGVKGIRIDAAKHQNAQELQTLMNKFHQELYRFLEVFANYGEAVQPPLYLPPKATLGQVTCFAFGFNLGPKFKGDSMLKDDLLEFGIKDTWVLDDSMGMQSSHAVVFVDNQDTQRADAPLTFQRDPVLYTLASAFMLAWPFGYPKVMSSYYWTDVNEGAPGVPVHTKEGKMHCGDGINWVCEHRNTLISNMVNFRKSAGDSPITHFSTVNGNFISFCRGDKACLAINKNSFSMNFTMQTDLPEGKYCDVAQSDSAECEFVIVQPGGHVSMTVPRMSAVAFHIGKRPALLFGVVIQVTARPSIYLLLFGGLSCMLAVIAAGNYLMKKLRPLPSPGHFKLLLESDEKPMGA